MTRIKNRACALLLALALLLSLVPEALAAEVQAEATTVQMTKTEGTVGISNSSGRSISLIEKMRLYNGYHVETEEKSYAWINLDSTKLSKLDAVSEMELRKSGKKLELLLNEGNLFFNVTEPLDDDESLNIRTSTIVVGIRGTCGWVKIIDQWRVEVYVLEGTVTITVTDPVTGQTKEEPVSGGEKATCVVYPQDKNGDKCDIILDTFGREDIDGFVLVELAPDEPLVEKIYGETGIDLRDWPENPEERLKEDQEKVAEKLREIEKELEEQDEHISTDPVWPDPAPTPTPEPEPEDNGEEEPAPTLSDVVILTLPVEDDVVDDYLNRGYVRQVIVKQQGTARASTGSILEVDSGITIPKGKTLTLDGGRVMINVLAGQTLEVNGTLTDTYGAQNAGYMRYVNSGTIINRGTIHNGIHMAGGNFVNRGTTDYIQFDRNMSTVDNAGGVILGISLTAFGGVPAASIVQGGTICAVDGNPTLVISASEAAGANLDWSPLRFVDCMIENEHGPAVVWSVDTASVDLDHLKATAKLPQMSNSTIRSRYYIVSAVGTSIPYSHSLVPTGYEVQQSGEWYYLVETGSTPVVPTPDPSTTCNVTFYANGGTWPGVVPVLSQDLQVAAGTTLQGAFDSGLITHPTREGYILTGWARDQAGNNPFATSSLLTDGLSLYAQWAAETTGGIDWRYDAATQTLTIFGSGAMPDYNVTFDYTNATVTGSDAPWMANQSEAASVVVEEGVTNISQGAFAGYSNLRSAELSDSVSSIGSYAFSACSNLTNINIPNGVTSIGYYTFYECSGLTSITIPNGVTSIGQYAFRNCSGLTSITIPDSVTSMGFGAVANCSSLTSMTIPNGITIISNAMFMDCSNLTNVTIPGGVVSIDDNAFYNCSALTTINFGGTEAQWNSITIGTNNDPLTTATIHYNSTPTPSPRTAQASPYSDVPLTASYAPAVLYCREHELMNGTDATHFTPDGTLTRAMMVTVLHRLAGTPAAGTASAFPDVASSQWYTQAVSWANSKGIVLGYPDGTFGVSDPVTHEQVALIFQRYSGGEAVEVVGAENPGAPATRAEIAATLMNYAKSGALSAVSAIDVMCAPSGIVPMGDGTVLVTDTYHKQLWKVNLGAGTVYAGGDTVTGLYGEPLGGYNDASLLESYFKEPWAAAPFLDGWAVSDTANNVVRLVRTKDTQTLNGKTSEGLTVTKLGVAFDRPTGLAADGKGNLYVSDTGKGAVRRITPEGKVTTVAKGLDQPMGLCWKNGVLYIAETGADRVVKLQNGQVAVVASGFNGPQGVAVGDDGAVYVADTSSGAVRMVRNGEVTTLVERDTAQVRSGLTAPRGLLVQDGRLYICDGFARKIFILRLG